MKILCLVNTLTSVNAFIYANHIAFFNHVRKHFPDLEMLHFCPNRFSIDHARNEAARLALEYEADYLMFIDDDVMLPKDALEGLLACESDIAAGLVIIRGWPFNVMAFRFTKDSTPEAPRLQVLEDLPRNKVQIIGEGFGPGYIYFDEIKKETKMTLEDFKKLPLPKFINVGAVGFSCALIKVALLKQLPKPFFVTGLNLTEDVYFCLKTLEYFPKRTCVMNTAIKCGHLMPQEPIEWDTRERFREFYKPAVEAAHVRNLSFLNKTLELMQ